MLNRKKSRIKRTRSKWYKIKILCKLVPLIAFFSILANTAVSQNIGFVLIKSNPSGASVFINGKDTDKKTPFQTQLEEGAYMFTVRYEIYHDFNEEIVVVKGQTITKDILLKSAYGNIRIVSEPTGADIKLDGVSVNKKTPSTLEKIPSGQHSISLSKDMYSDKVEKVTVNDELTTEVFSELLAGYGTVGIVAKPDASISIDGNNSGSGNYFGRLTPGKHKIVISRKNYYPQQQEITLNQGQEEKINIQLKPIVGTLSIMVDPPETAIYLNSKYYGLSPKILDSLTIGDYDLELTKEGFAIFRQHLNIEENKTIQINNSLQQGKLIKVRSNPEGAEVLYNGSVIGATPAEFVVQDGSNRIILRKKYYADKEITINAEKNDQDFIFNLEVDRKSVNIGIETKPSRAVVRLNEKAFLPELRSLNNLPVYSGTSPYNSQIPIGRYDIKIEKKGFNTIEKEIIVEKNENLSFNLKPLKYHTKGTALLLSVLWPGAGQSYLKRGSAHFLMGFAGYGALTYSFVQHSQAVKNYDLYLAENNPQTRESLKSEYKNNLNMSDYAMYTGVAVWGVNLIWTLIIPSEHRKYRNVQFSMINSTDGPVPGIGWRTEF